MKEVTSDFISGWRDAFLVLSLDYALIFWGKMGLFFSDEIKAQIQLFAREGYAAWKKNVVTIMNLKPTN